MYFESHAHYDDKRFREDREELLSTLLPASGVDTVINIGCDVKSSEMSIRLAEKYPYVYASVGVHPHEVGEMSSQTIEKLRNLSTHPKMPVVIHSRDAAQETFEIIESSAVRRGVIHCYSGALPMAQDYVDMGFHIGIGGVVTFSNAKKLVEVAEGIPMEKILIETDSPYLAPNPNRGKRNDSRNLKYIVEKIAEIKGILPEIVAETASRNAKSLFLQN